jgi:hypothetical protein
MLPLLAPMDVAQQASFQARVEERLRVGNDVNSEETDINPQVRYDAIGQGGNAHFVVYYAPRLVLTQTFSRELPDPNLVNPETINTSDPNDTPVSVQHNAGIGFEYIQPRWRLAAYQFASYGPVTTTTLLIQKPWEGGEVPADPQPIVPATVAARFTLLFAQTQLSVPIRVSRRVAVIPGFVYNAFGGATSDDRAAMALSYGPGAFIDVDVAASKSDRLVSHVGAGQVSTLFQGDRTGASIVRAEATQSWRHWFTNQLSLEGVGGGSIASDEISGTEAFGIAQVDMIYDTWLLQRIDPGAPPAGAPLGHGNRLQVALMVKAVPWLDFFSGELEERALGIAAANYGIGPIMFRAQVSAAKVFNNPDSVSKYTFFSTEASVRYAFAPTWFVDGGVRYGYQDFANAIRFDNITQATFFAGVTWAPLPARF